ncbi:MAG: type IV secretory system conjugative DNA transfer family protein [Tannerellaceae bacterium]|nr:type IV secretory system conjugative DNA transfer family protein [Tannerellaceae bacterium]
MNEMIALLRYIAVACVGLLALLLVIRFVRTAFTKKSIKTVWSSKADGIILGLTKLGRYVVSPSSDEGHSFIVGGSGSGKTSAVLIPTLRRWNGTFLAFDISGDICNNVECDNKLVYAPCNTETVPYNIFSLIDGMKDTDDQNEALSQLAFLLMPELVNANANAKYFQDNGRNILTASLIAFYHSGLDFCEICETIVANNYKRLFSMIDATGNETAKMLIGNFEGNSEQNTAGCKQSCDMAILFFATNEKVKSAIRRPAEGEVAFTPSSIEKYKVFVCIPDAKLSVYAPLMSIIVSQCLTYFSDRPKAAKRNILFALDEFASFGKLEIVGALRKLRKKHIRIMILTQSLSDLIEKYGVDGFKTMLANFQYVLILNVTEKESQEYLAQMIGQKPTTRESTTSSGGLFSVPTSKTQSTEKDYIIQPSELARLGDNLILLYPDGVKKLRKAYYFRDKKK